MIATRTLGKNGLTTPRLVLGGNVFGWTVKSREDSFRILDRFAEVEGLSGSKYADYLRGSEADANVIATINANTSALDAAGIARVAGLQAGEYDYLEEIIPDQINVLQDSPNAMIEILPPRSYGVVILNTAGGPMANQTIRQAVLAAVLLLLFLTGILRRYLGAGAPVRSLLCLILIVVTAQGTMLLGACIT